VVLRGVKAFHRSPSSTLSTETTSFITLTPTDTLPAGLAAQGWKEEGEPPS
jgi:hypothetical protein